MLLFYNKTEPFINHFALVPRMELRELKKEVENLPDVQKNLHHFKASWLDPLRQKSSPLNLKSLHPHRKKELDRRLVQVHKHLQSLEESNIINTKLQQYARYLIELKLTTFNGDTQKSKTLKAMLLHDDFLSLKGTIQQVKDYDQQLTELRQHYKQINVMLQQELSLEETVSFLELPHARYLQNLLLLGEQQKSIIRDLGRHFITLCKTTKTTAGRP